MWRGFFMAIWLTALGGAIVGWPAVAQDSLFKQGKSLLQGLGSADKSSIPGGELAIAEIVQGLKEALRVGTGRVVDTLGRADGFNGNDDVHIPLPGTLQTVQETLAKVGMSGLADDLELRLNRAAEAAVPRVKELFVQAIVDMTLEDARAIYDGPDDAATQYFSAKMSKALAHGMRPIIEQEIAAAGVIRSYDDMMGRYRSLPFVPDAKADLIEYVLEKGIDGIFLFLGREEAAIRDNPAARTTDILKRVFGA